MSNVTYETRQISFLDIQDKKKKRYEQILNRLSDKEMSAKEIAVEMYELGMIPSTDRNYTAPRFNELEKMCYVKIVGSKKCKWSGKKVSIYKKMTEAERLSYLNENHIPGY